MKSKEAQVFTRMVVLPAAILAIGVFAPGIANAAGFTTTNAISISSGGDGFQGKVGSPRGSCVANRTVTLQRMASRAGSFAAVGSDKTDRRGDWEVKTNPQGQAQYNAVVTEKSLGGGNRCRSATSKALTARPTKSSVAIGERGASFNGQIASVRRCLETRTIKLQRKGPGQTRFTTVGNPDTSSGAGAWEVTTSPVDNTQYRGSVAAKTVGDDACMAAYSSITTARKSTVEIEQGGATNFHGTVESVAACEPARAVTLQSRDIYTPTFIDIGSNATKPSGAWRVNTSIFLGAFYRASVAARQAGSISCLDDRSPEVVAS